MYCYIIEKTISAKEPVVDIALLNNLTENVENIHRFIGKLFQVEKTKNWRSINNILYRVLDIETCKLLIYSSIPISLDVASDLKFIIREIKLKELKNGDHLLLKVFAAPFKTNKDRGCRVFIDSIDERKEWIKNKLTYNNECEVIDIKEGLKKEYNMKHINSEKGSCRLIGCEYFVDVKLKDADSFKNLLVSGIGPNKNYGFGLIEF